MDPLSQLRQELAAIEQQIARLEGRHTGDERYLDEVSRSFPLGRVGGSDKAVQSLNRRRARALDATIDRAVAIVPLYKQRERLQAAIARIEARPADWQERQHRAELALVRYFAIIVVRKSRLSITSENGVRWSIGEVTGLHMARCRELLAEIEAEPTPPSD